MQNGFDIQLAIAALEPQAYMPAPFPALRDKYPELRFVFDELESLRELALATVPAEDHDQLQDDYQELEKKLDETRNALDRVSKALNSIMNHTQDALDELNDIPT